MDEVFYNTNLINMNILLMNRHDRLNEIKIDNSLHSPKSKGDSYMNTNSPNHPSSSPISSSPRSPSYSPSYSPVSSYNEDTYLKGNESLLKGNESLLKDEQLSFLKNIRNFNKSIIVNSRR